MARTLIPSGKADMTGFRRWFRAEYDYCPGWYTVLDAVRQGMPCEQHPLRPGKLIFDLEACRAWIEARRNEPLQIGPSKPLTL